MRSQTEEGKRVLIDFRLTSVGSLKVFFLLVNLFVFKCGKIFLKKSSARKRMPTLLNRYPLFIR